MAQGAMYPLRAGGKETTLTADVTAADTQFNLTDLTDIPSAPNIITIKTSSILWERCRYTARVVTSGVAGYITVERSGDLHASSAGGTALSWSVGAKVLRPVAECDITTLQVNVGDHETRLSGLTSRSITAGEGISGGGTLESDVSVALDLSELEVITSPADDDYIPVYRTTGGHKRIQKSNLIASADVFGFAWNTLSSSPVLTRIDQNGDTINPLISKFNYHPLWGGIKRCSLTSAGVATYGSDAKGTAGLTTTNDYMMVEIPQAHVLEWTDGDYRCFCLGAEPFSGEPMGSTINSVVHPWFNQRGGSSVTPCTKGYIGAYKASANGTTSLSSKSGVAPLANIDMATFESRGNAIGTNWGITNVWYQSLLQLLMYTEFANLNIQSALAPGFTNASNTGPQTCGANDSLMGTNGTGGGTDVQGVNYRGINNPYGDLYEFRIGWNSLNAEYHILNRDGSGTIAATLASGSYESTSGITPLTGVNGYANKVLDVNPLKLMFVPSAIAGSETTYLCDYFYGHTSGQTGCLLAGGDWTNAGNAGPGFLAATYAVSYVHPAIGARVEFLGVIS